MTHPNHDRTGEIIERLAEDTRELAYLQARAAAGEHVDELTIASFRHAPEQLARELNIERRRPTESYERVSQDLRAGAYRHD